MAGVNRQMIPEECEVLEEIKKNSPNLNHILIYPSLYLKRDEEDKIQRAGSRRHEITELFEILKNKNSGIFIELQKVAWNQGQQDFFETIRQTLVNKEKREFVWVPDAKDAWMGVPEVPLTEKEILQQKEKEILQQKEKEILQQKEKEKEILQQKEKEKLQHNQAQQTFVKSDGHAGSSAREQNEDEIDIT